MFSAEERFGPNGERYYPLPEDFETLDEYFDKVEEITRRNSGLGPKRKKRPPGLGRVPTSDSGGMRQVGLRLPSGEFDDLKKLSRDYGLRPASLARMLVVRGLRALSGEVE
jgi:hypothetical protein